LGQVSRAKVLVDFPKRPPGFIMREVALTYRRRVDPSV
jgi:hypothetical protein